ncbi:hypothetical protein ACJZ2D_016905 [Fusarium nematophilum]
MVALCDKRETVKRDRIQQRAKACLPIKAKPFEIEHKSLPSPDRFPLLLHTAQCPDCVGDERLSREERAFTYCRPTIMNDHFDDQHLVRREQAEQSGKRIRCEHPKCRDVRLQHLDHFRSHVQRVHGVALRTSKQVKQRRQRKLVFYFYFGIYFAVIAFAFSLSSGHGRTDIYSSVSGIVFLGTPHNGSGTAGWGLIASNLAKFALQRPSKSILRGLEPNNEVLENLQRTFLQMLEDGHFTIHSFYETVPMPGVKGLKGLVVPYDSAVVGHAKKVISLGITATHSSICKFSGPSDPGYQAVFGALQEYVRAAGTHVSTE